MISFFLFVLDFCVAAIFDQWFIHTLAAYFIYLILYKSDNSVHMYGVLFLLLLQDFFLYDRFGLLLLPIIPLLVTGRVFSKIFHYYWYPVVYEVLLIFFFFLRFFLIKKWVLGLYSFGKMAEFVIFGFALPQSTIIEIFGIIIVGFFFLLGTWGSRFFRHF